MAEKIVIEVYKTKDNGELTKLIADPASRLETGSAVAVSASMAAALLCRCAAAAAAAGAAGERIDYIARNGEILRTYMVHLIDEDVKCRGPLRRAEKEGKPQEIDAARRPAVSICEEIVAMMGKCLELLLDVCGICPEDALHYAASAADLAMGAARSAVRYILNMSSKSTEETYRFVTRRENEITLGQYEELYGKIIKKVNG